MSVLVCQSDFNWLYPLGSPEQKEESKGQILTVRPPPPPPSSSDSKLAVTHALCFSCRAHAGALWVVSSTIFFGHQFFILTFLTFWRPGGSAMQGWVLGTITAVCRWDSNNPLHAHEKWVNEWGNWWWGMLGVRRTLNIPKKGATLFFSWLVHKEVFHLLFGFSALLSNTHPSPSFKFSLM